MENLIFNLFCEAERTRNMAMLLGCKLDERNIGQHTSAEAEQIKALYEQFLQAANALNFAEECLSNLHATNAYSAAQKFTE